MKTLHNKQWFLDRIGKKIFRDDSTCGCATCNDIVENGLIITGEDKAAYLYEYQNDYASDGIYLNYRDEK